MKSWITMAAVLFMSSSAFANTAEIRQFALRALLAQNPLATNSEGSTMSISGLMASSIVSNFDANGRGNLAVVRSECSPGAKPNLFTCSVTVIDSDREIKNDAYVPTRGMTESALGIGYTYDVDTNTVSDVTYDVAG